MSNKTPDFNFIGEELRVKQGFFVDKLQSPNFDLECVNFRRVGHAIEPKDFIWNNTETDGRLSEYIAKCKKCNSILGIKYDPLFDDYFMIQVPDERYLQPIPEYFSASQNGYFYMRSPHIESISSDGHHYPTKSLIPLSKKILINNNIMCSNLGVLK